MTDKRTGQAKPRTGEEISPAQQDPRGKPAASAVREERDYEMPVARLADAQVDSPVFIIRGHKVMLEQDVARLYEVETATLIRAVRRNASHFPVDFLFKLTPQEYTSLEKHLPEEYRQVRRNRFTPYAFTEAGVAMVSQVINSARAHHVNVTIIRDFVRLRKLCGSNLELADKLDVIDAKYDQQFKKLFAALEALQMSMKPPDRRVGFYVS